MEPQFLPFALPLIGPEEEAEVLDVLRSGWITTGPRCQRFEREFAEFVGARHALAVNSATAGLHLALEAIGIGPGDQVITTDYTFTATAEVIHYLGGEPLLVDIDPRTFNLDPQQVADALRRSPRVKAIMPVHFAGQACPMQPLMELAERHGVKLVEDAAHALPTTYRGRMVGTMGDCTVFSFYATKTITTAEGGMVVTDDDALARRMKVMRLHGISRDAFDRYTSKTATWQYEVIAAGYKYNMSDLAAALGIHQLAKAHAFQARRAEIAQRYTRAFADLPVRTPHVADPGDLHAWHLYVLQLELEHLPCTRDEFIERLRARQIGASVHFIPLHLHPFWRQQLWHGENAFAVAGEVFRRAVSLPIYPRMSDADVERVISAVRQTCETGVQARPVRRAA